MAPKISIVIPTRERGEYVGHAVETCLACDDADLEVIVSDNASADGTRETVSAIGDLRLKYVNTGRRVSMRANFEFGLGHATGDYVIAIGDDDGVLPNGMAVLRGVLEREPHDLVHWTPVLFEWPGGGSRGGRGHALVKASVVYGGTRKLPTGPLAVAAYSAGLRNFRDCPGIYHACVSRRFVDEMRARSGEVFRGHIPDVYFCFSALLLADDFLHLEHPVSISGASPKSNGAATHPLSRGAESARIKALFREEASLDGEQEPIDLSLRSLSANQLSALIVADRIFGDGMRTIDWRRWIERILGDFALLDAEERQASLEALRRDLAPFGAATVLDEALKDRRFSDASAPSRARSVVSSPTRLVLGFEKKATVADAARRLDSLLPTYVPGAAGPLTPLARTLRWGRMLMRASSGLG